MRITTLLQARAMSVVDYRCAALPSDKPFIEQHDSFSLSYVRKGSFGCHARSKNYELVAGSLFVGYPGDEFACTHDHHACGDECLSFRFSPELVSSIGDRAETWRITAVAPLPELVILGERAQAAADSHSGLSLEEAGTLLIMRFIECVSERGISSTRSGARDRRRAIEAALWIDENAQEPISLDEMARRAGLSSFHFLRVFRAVTGLTPHQYLIRCRLRRAVRLMADKDRSITEIAFECGFNDFTNFIRTFRRASRFSPGRFRGWTDPGGLAGLLSGRQQHVVGG
jgi:AraC family transcriptional regulator